MCTCNCIKSHVRMLLARRSSLFRMYYANGPRVELAVLRMRQHWLNRRRWRSRDCAPGLFLQHAAASKSERCLHLSPPRTTTSRTVHAQYKATGQLSPSHTHIHTLSSVCHRAPSFPWTRAKSGRCEHPQNKLN